MNYLEMFELGKLVLIRCLILLEVGNGLQQGKKLEIKKLVLKEKKKREKNIKLYMCRGVNDPS